MTDKTATQNLTRTTASDDPRQVAAYLKQLATDADQRVTAHFYDLARSVAPPFAVARLTIPTAINSSTAPPGGAYNGSIPFDTVEIDTAGMVDLSVDPYTIYPPETGYYWVGGYALLTGFGASNADAFVTAHMGGFNFQDPRHDGLFGFVGSSATGEVRVTTVPASRPAVLTVGFQGGSTGPTTTVFFAELWVIKVRDL